MIRILRSVALLLVMCFLVQGQRISEIECSKFREGTIERAGVIALTMNPRPIILEKFNCSKTVDLIVGGEDAKPGEFPHQALLGWPEGDEDEGEYRFECGGSLISERFVLTAAHCFINGYARVVRLAEHSIHDYGDEVDLDIERCFKHPQYRSNKSYHDIALCKLKQKVKVSKLIRPACLWTGSEINVTSVIATGFGVTDFAGDKVNILQKVKLDFVRKSECVAKVRGMSNFPDGVLDSQLCIGSDAGGKDTCQGDSGGPVQVITEPKGCMYHVIGVTSTALASCGVGRSAAIYTRVSDYLDWIEGMVWGDFIKKYYS